MLTEQQRHFLETERVARFASADDGGQPHIVPICYAVMNDKVYFTIDQKPKRGDGELKRLNNIRANPKVALIIDHYDEDWSKLGWIMIRGKAAILRAGSDHQNAQARLRERYPQLHAMPIDHLPVVSITMQHVISWGDLKARPKIP